MQARDHLHSDNIGARLALPPMAFEPGEQFAVFAAATRGLTDLEAGEPEFGNVSALAGRAWRRRAAPLSDLRNEKDS